MAPSRLHFPLERNAPAIEVCSGERHKFKEQVQFSSGAVEFHGQQRLLLNQEVPVTCAWTIMVSFKTPMPKTRGFQNVCSNYSVNGAHILMVGGDLGVWISGGGGTQYCEPMYNVHNRLADYPGWHHLAAVGQNGKTTCYIDGTKVGVVAVQNTKELGAIGHMYPGGALDEGFGGVMKDFMLFQEALQEKEIAEYACRLQNNNYLASGSVQATSGQSAMTLHVPFGIDSKLGLEVINQKLYTFQDDAVELSPEGGVMFDAQQRLIFDPPVPVTRAWTIMVLFKTPMPKTSGFQNVCSNYSVNGAHILMNGGDLGVWISGGGGTQYCKPMYNVHNRLADYPGWHHLAAVGQNGKTTCYIDGTKVGVVAVQNTKELGAIGHMYPGGDLDEGFGGVMKDFMLFQKALTEDEIWQFFTQECTGNMLPSKDVSERSEYQDAGERRSKMLPNEDVSEGSEFQDAAERRSKVLPTEDVSERSEFRDAAKRRSEPQSIVDIFQRFDRNGDGHIDEDELKTILQRLDSGLTDEAAHALFEANDSDHNGYIDYEEFVNWINYCLGEDDLLKLTELAQKRITEVEYDEGTDSSAMIRGLFDDASNPLLSITDAVAALPFDLKSELWLGKRHCRKGLAKKTCEEVPGLDLDGSIAIHLYTVEGPLYKELNRQLRGRARGGTEFRAKYYPYLRLLVEALQKIARAHSARRTINRGVKRGLVKELPDEFVAGESLIWWGFSSCTENIAVLSNDAFLGKSGDRTIFQIQTRHGVDISAFSSYPGEAEVLLPPGTVFKIDGVLDVGNGLTIIQCSDDDDAPTLMT